MWLGTTRGSYATRNCVKKVPRYTNDLFGYSYFLTISQCGYGLKSSINNSLHDLMIQKFSKSIFYRITDPEMDPKWNSRNSYIHMFSKIVPSWNSRSNIFWTELCNLNALRVPNFSTKIVRRSDVILTMNSHLKKEKKKLFCLTPA